MTINKSQSLIQIGRENAHKLKVTYIQINPRNQ